MYQYEEQEYSLIPNGKYEGIITAEIKTSKKGKQYVSISFKIRDDIIQPCKNRVVFDNIFKDKEHPEMFNKKRINSLLGAVLTEKEKAEHIKFNSIEDVLKKINGSKVAAAIEIVNNEYTNDKDVNKIEYYDTTRYPNQKIELESEEVSNDDLPF
mgnify:CR=1 FL=1